MGFFGDIWDGVKSAAKTVGDFVGDNAGKIGGVVGGAIGGPAGAAVGSSIGGAAKAILGGGDSDGRTRRRRVQSSTPSTAAPATTSPVTVGNLVRNPGGAATPGITSLGPKPSDYPPADSSWQALADGGWWGNISFDEDDGLQAEGGYGDERDRRRENAKEAASSLLAWAPLGIAAAVLGWLALR